MLSYRHAFHAGNHADVLKHFCLYEVLRYFNHKDKAYCYIDTHAGAGLYDLQATMANKTAEYLQGIALLQKQTSLPSPLADFMHFLNRQLPSNTYCGSPWIAKKLTRKQDKLWLFELHPSDFPILQHNMQQGLNSQQIYSRKENGFNGLIGLLPPPTGRAVVLIDPPYEEKQDYQQLFNTLQKALKRFAHGCYIIWYPCLSREESLQLPEQLKSLNSDYIDVKLRVQSPAADGFGMFGSGLFIINPPYTLNNTLKEILPSLVSILGQERTADYELNSSIS